MTAIRRAGALVACLLAVPVSAARALPHPDHHEFEATVRAQYQAAPGASREALLEFSFPDADALLAAAWRVEVLDSRGARLRTVYGETALQRGFGRQSVAWDGKDGKGAPAAAGFYTLRLTARAVPLTDVLARSGTPAPVRVEQFLASAADRLEERADLRVGTPPAPKLLPFRALQQGAGQPRSGRITASTAATGSFPYTIYYGNLHSQTNHTDGGGDVSSCTTSENPWAGTFGPTDAWEMMRTQAGGDILLTSEHNHMYDGSTSTDPLASTAHAHALFNGGVQAASDYTAAHPGFLALYGTEWGVISNGGHMNVLNPDGLATWESNSSGTLFGDFLVAKSDYAAMYSLMKSRGWVGQFNHPQLSQFAINGVSLAYDANADEVMALCEVNNTNAFSHNTTETETSKPNYEIVWQALLERGYHVAPSSDQDNHCANWGLSYTNRTGVLIPDGTPLSKASFLDAVRARHVFATLDKRSQIVFATSAGGLMGDRVANSGPLTLNVFWATTGAHTVSRTQIFEGVPGRNGVVTQLSDGLSSVTLTPSTGQHFYYAVITEENGDKLWSAPIWVTQSAGAVAANIDQPAGDQSVANGTTISFSGSATTQNGSIVSTAWDFGDGTTASGSTASHTYTNPGASTVTYLASFTATDDQGATGAATRSITVQPDASLNTPPTITAIGNVTLVKNSNATASFTVSDAQTSPALLDVSAAAGDSTLFPAGSLVPGGAGSARTLTLTPAPGRTGTSAITVTVADAAGATASSVFTATVISGQPVLIISQYYEGTSNNKWLEITNVGDAQYSGSGLFIGSWFNPATGGTTYSVNPISQTIPAGGTVLFKNSLAALPDAAHVTGTPTSISGGAMQFNGDDITYITTVNANNVSSYNARVDSIGLNQTSWTASGGSGAAGGMDRSYVRNSGVISQSVDYVASQWTRLTLAQVDGSASGTTERLGEHLFNHAPSISDLSDVTVYAGDAVGPLSFTVGDAETSADALVVTAASSNEQLLPASSITFGGSGASRTLSATPVADQVGSSAITLTVTDGGGRTSSTGFLVTVNAPVITGVTISPASAYLHGGAQQQFTAQVSGLGSFSTQVRWSATGGSIDANGLYSPPLSGGPYLVTAASAQDPSFSASATVTTNSAPVAADSSVETDGNTAVSVALQASDADGDALTFSVVTPPAHGQLTGSDANLTYAPDQGFSGSDAVTFSVTDGFSSPVMGQVTITVHALNHAPVAFGAQLATDEDTAVAAYLSATDVDGDALSYAVLQAPAHGRLTGAAPDLTYLPDPGWTGADAFTFTAFDGALVSNEATVTIVVRPVNHAPVAQGQSLHTLEDTAAAITLSATDVDGDALTFSIVTPPTHGQLTGSGANLTYTPDHDWNGVDQLTFAASDGQLSGTATVVITVDPVDDAPVAYDQSLTTPEDTPLALQLGATDVEGDPLTFAVSAPPVHGHLTGAPPNLTYVPDANWNGADAFTFTANDGALDSGQATVTIVVSPVNDAPVAQGQPLQTLEDTAIAITLSATDVDGDALTFSIVTPPAHGQLSGSGANLTYTPAGNFNGVDQFTFAASDGQLTGTAQVVITVAPVDDAPVAHDQSLTTPEDTPIALQLAATDVEGNPLNFRVVAPPVHGHLTGVAPNLTYVPDANWNGSDAFGFVANDGQLDSAVATVFVTVTPVNDAPVAASQSVRTRLNSPVSIVLSATDLDGDPLTWRIVSQTKHGTLSGSGAQVLYTPKKGYTGADSFRFVANDGKLDSLPATVSIEVSKGAATAHLLSAGQRAR